jgi:poly-gamma-glutamate capsule biosynthesis protein CapA/YwtB (metallophosphatase superfamily)
MRHRHATRLLAVLAFAATGVACASSGSASGSSRPRVASSKAASHGSTPKTPRAAAGLIRLTAVGDTILGNTPNLPPDPASYLDAVKRKIRWNAQIRFANLEGTLTSVSSGKCGGHNGGNCFAFRNPPHYARYLHHAGFTILNNANNHSHDFGEAGLQQTIRAIHHHHMKQSGKPGEITVVHAGAVPVAIVGFAPYSNTADLLKLKAAKHLITKARRKAHIVVVYMHAGAEGSSADHVTGHEEYFVGEDRGNPEKFAHMAIRNGASLVIASGPHVVRGMQFFHGHLIAYSLGNFANFHNFGGGGDLSDSAILHVELTPGGRFAGGRLISVQLDSSGHPTLGGGTVSLVRRLSKQDFGKGSRAHFNHRGVISQPSVCTDRCG